MSDLTLIDTDAGVDDMLALLLLYSLTRPEALDIGVTFGNVPLERAIRNVALFMQLRDVAPRQVLRGSVAPLVGKAWSAENVHGDDGVGGVTREKYSDAPEIATADLAASMAGASYARMIAIGPLTDLCHLARQGTIAPLLLMGGAFEHPGNMSPYAEFNMFCDAEAAAEVFAGWPADIRVVPLDLSHQVTLQRRWLDDVSARYPTPAAIFMRDIHQHYMDVYGGREGIDGCHPHDALAVFAAFFPDAVEWQRGRVHVVTEGEQRARTVLTPDESGPHYVAQSLDQARFFEALERAFAVAAG
jgi:inosine-uridine nucleoside N-ribohydrolase